MNIYRLLQQKIKWVSLSVILAVSTFILTECKSPHGEVTIYGIIDTVDNCSVPYSVYFYPDFEVGGGDVSFLWDFGDGTSSDERNPSHIYAQTGLFQVTLAITNRDKTEKKSINLDLQQTSLPVISGFDFSSNSNLLWAPSEIFFYNLSEHATSFWWEFGDGDFSQKKQPSHTYTSPGNFTVKLMSICNGDTARSQTPIQILSPPSEVIVENVNVWLPASYTGANLFCAIHFDGFHEYTTDDYYAGSFPVSFNISKQLFGFNSFNSDILLFEIRNASNYNNIVYTFSLPMVQLKDDYYPTLVTWDSGNDFAAEVTFGYTAK